MINLHLHSFLYQCTSTKNKIIKFNKVFCIRYDSIGFSKMFQCQLNYSKVTQINENSRDYMCLLLVFSKWPHIYSLKQKFINLNFQKTESLQVELSLFSEDPRENAVLLLQQLLIVSHSSILEGRVLPSQACVLMSTSHFWPFLLASLTITLCSYWAQRIIQEIFSLRFKSHCKCMVCTETLVKTNHEAQF